MTKQTINLAGLHESAEQASSLMKVLANPDRLILLCQLSAGEKSVGELEAASGIQQPSLSQQLSVLRERKVVDTRREGKSIYYSIASEPALEIMHVLSNQLCNLHTIEG